MFHVFLYKLHYDICHNIIQYAVSFLPTLNQFFLHPLYGWLKFSCCFP